MGEPRPIPRRDVTPAVFFDRDGVLCDPVLRRGRPFPPASVEACVVSASAPEAAALLLAAGFLLFVVSNQPDIARGATSAATVTAIDDKIAREIPIVEFLICPHDDADGCRCRKPKPGLIEDAARRYDVDLGRSYVVGDRWRDVGAGASAGCTTVFVDRAYNEERPTNQDVSVASVADAASWIRAHAERHRVRG